MLASFIGAEFREVVARDHDGRPARAVIARRSYATTPADLWDALTNRERIPRWFLPVEGELKLGGRYQLQGNAGGTITRCDPPQALDLTWEFAGATSWVNVRLAAQGEATLLTLEHIIPVVEGDAHWDRFGPGAVGVGWDLSLIGLAQHIASGGAQVDPEAFQAWTLSDEGKQVVRDSATAWADAHVAGGEDDAVARGMAERTAAFYTGG